MSGNCTYQSAPNYDVEITVLSSECPKMPAGDKIILEGPSINYDKSGPVCLTAINAVYPWIMLSRFDVKTDALDYDPENSCYYGVCPCGTVKFKIRNFKE